jgi:SAM-dependent methyltransferase
MFFRMKSLAEKRSLLTTLSTEAIDKLFHLRPITDVVRSGDESLYLQGLTPEALYTSYHDLLHVMPWLYREGARSWCDIGCGVGRTSLLWSWLFPDGESHGIELVSERLEEARAASRALGLSQTYWIEGDFASPSLTLPEADVYFIYLATGPQLDALLAKLKRRSQMAWVVVIESHGDLKPRLSWESWWLTGHLQRFALSSARHDPWIHIYRTRVDHPVLQLEDSWEGRSGIMPADLSLHPSPLGYILGKSFQRHWELVVEEDGILWTMDCLGLRWHAPEKIEGEHPPRVVGLSTHKIGLRRLPEDLHYRRWVEWRRKGQLLSYKARGDRSGQRVKIRKIMLVPESALEFSDGARIQWSELLTLEVMS